MSSPLLWFSSKAKLLKSILQIPGSTSGSIDLAAPATPTPYQITLPPAQGTSGQVPTLDGSLNLQWVTPSSNPVTTFALTNNQVTPANVTGFLVNSAVNTAFHADVSVRQEATVTVVGGNDGTPNAAFQTGAGTGANNVVICSITLPDNSVIIAGDFTAYDGVGTPRIAKISSAGVLDATFTANLNVGPNGTVRALYRQPSGKIVVGGDFTQFDGSSYGRIARINADGTLDATFGNVLGEFDASVNGISQLSATNNSNLIVVGAFANFVAEDGITYPVPYIIGLDEDGQYTTPGINFVPVGTSLNNIANAVVVNQTTDDVYVAGLFTSYNAVAARLSIKLDATGAKQTGFDALGHSSSVEGSNLVLQPDGKLVVSGDINRSAPDKVDMWRYDNAGADDTTFNNNLALVVGSGSAPGLALQSDGKVLLGGGANYNGVRRFSRYNSDGTSDSAFNTAILPGFNSLGNVNTIALAADDVAYVGGFFSSYYTGVIANNIILLGQFGSSTTTETWLKTAIDGVYKSASLDWEIGFDTGVVSSPAPGVAFTMLPSGQLQYTTTNLSGTIALNEMRFSIVGL